jgi:hypothetical protein
MGGDFAGGGLFVSGGYFESEAIAGKEDMRGLMILDFGFWILEFGLETEIASIHGRGAHATIKTRCLFFLRVLCISAVNPSSSPWLPPIFPRILGGIYGKMPWFFGNQYRINLQKIVALKWLPGRAGKSACFDPFPRLSERVLLL